MEKNDRKMALLEDQGFECALVERNCMCKHKTFVPSQSPYTKSTLKKFNGRDRSASYSGTNKDVSS